MSDAGKNGGDFILDNDNLPMIEGICNGMPGGFFIYKAYGDEEIIYFNHAMLRIFGCENDDEFRELTKNSFKGIVHPDDYERVQRSIEEQITGDPNKLDYVEYRIICRDKSIRWVEDYGHFIATENYGDVFYVFINDATERMRKRMDELERINTELKIMCSRESQYRRAILCNADTFFEANISKNKLISKVHNNERGSADSLCDFSDVTEYTQWVQRLSEFTEEKSVDDFLDFFSTERLISCYEKDEPEQVMDTVIIDRSGKNRILEFELLLGKSDVTEDIVVLTVIKDITKTNERKRIIKTALSEANAGNIARQSFLTNISRDILAPINSIVSFTELSSYNTSDSDLLNYCLDNIKESGRQLLEIVGESLRINDMNSGVMKLRKLEFNLNDLLDDVRQRIYPEASKKNIDFKIDKSGVENFNVVAYEIRLEEVLLHLLDNAVKFTGKGGSVTLKVTEADGLEDGAKNYIFEVEDNGIGIGESFADKMFEPFKREPSDTVSGIRGSGMGLTVVKNHVDMMKGTVTVESKQGQGSRFKVTLPFTLQEKKPT